MNGEEVDDGVEKKKDEETENVEYMDGKKDLFKEFLYLLERQVCAVYIKSVLCVYQVCAVYIKG